MLCGIPGQSEPCKTKQRVPTEKVQKFVFIACFYNICVVCQIYKEKTIEVGVYIDRHLYKNMEEVRLHQQFCYLSVLVEVKMPI